MAMCLAAMHMDAQWLFSCEIRCHFFAYWECLVSRQYRASYRGTIDVISSGAVSVRSQGNTKIQCNEGVSESSGEIVLSSGASVIAVGDVMVTAGASSGINTGGRIVLSAGSSAHAAGGHLLCSAGASLVSRLSNGDRMIIESGISAFGTIIASAAGEVENGSVEDAIRHK